MQKQTSILFVGCGKMGGSILEGLIQKNVPSANLYVAEPNKDIQKELQKKGIKTADNVKDFCDITPSFVFLAVKPFLIQEIIKDIKPFTDKGAAIISIIAGRKIKWFENELGKDVIVFRTMPNTPAAIGKGITGIATNGLENAQQKEDVQALFETCGKAIWLDTEDKIDSITALSGSGPAYLFYFTEALKQAGIALGFSEQDALLLAKETVIGATELMSASSESPAKLRENVTTPNGTTAAALDVLMDTEKGFEPLLVKALDNAKKRSKELSNA